MTKPYIITLCVYKVRFSKDWIVAGWIHALHLLAHAETDGKEGLSPIHFLSERTSVFHPPPTYSPSPIHCSSAQQMKLRMELNSHDKQKGIINEPSVSVHTILVNGKRLPLIPSLPESYHLLGPAESSEGSSIVSPNAIKQGN